MAENKAVLVEEVTLPTGCCFNSSLCHLYEEAPKFKKKSCDIFRCCWFIVLLAFGSQTSSAQKMVPGGFHTKQRAIWTVCLLPFDRLFPPLSSSRRCHYVTSFLLAPAHFLQTLHQSFTPFSPPTTPPYMHTHTHTIHFIPNVRLPVSLLFYTSKSLNSPKLSFFYLKKNNCSPAFPHTVEGERRVEVVG